MEADSSLKLAAHPKPEANKAKKQGFFAGKLVHALVLAVVSFLFVAGNFFYEHRYEEAQQIAVQKNSTISYSGDSLIADGAVVRFDAERIDPAMEKTDVEGLYRLSQGRIWGNFVLEDQNININLKDKLVLIPEFASFDLEFDGSGIKLAVYDGNVYLGILAEGAVQDDLADKYDKVFINRFLVPKGTQVTIPISKITDRLTSLLYSKLSKEFKLTGVTNADSEWVTSNSKKDSKFIEKRRQIAISNAIDTGDTLRTGFVSTFILWAEENLSFVPEKKQQVVLNHLFAYLDDALFFAADGDVEGSAKSLDGFKNYLNSLDPEIAASSELDQRLDTYIQTLSVFGSGDTQIDVFKQLLQIKFANSQDRGAVVEDFWPIIYQAMDDSTLKAQEALDAYYNYLDDTLGQNASDSQYVAYITYQNQLFDNLFMRSPIFYEEAYFAMKNALEQELLRLYDGRIREELAQDLISKKIEFLKRLNLYFFEEDVSVDEAKDILSRLVGEIDALMPAGSSSAAVVDLFEARLDDIDDFWGYLNSPEYYTSKTYGLTQKDRYQSYLKERDKIWSFINIQEDVLGEQVQEDVDVEEIERAIQAVFAKNDDFKQVKIAELKDPTQRYVDVSAVVGGYAFQAKYDRDAEYVTDIYAYDELLADRPVKLDAVYDLLVNRFADLDDKGDIGQEFDEASNAERTLKRYLAGLAKKAGFVATEDDVEIVDEENAIYRIGEIYLESDPSVLVTFDYVATTEKADNLYLKIDGKSVILEGEYEIEELPEVVALQKKVVGEGRVLR